MVLLELAYILAWIVGNVWKHLTFWHVVVTAGVFVIVAVLIDDEDPG